MQDKNTLAGLCAKNAYLLDTIVHVYETESNNFSSCNLLL